MQKKLLFLLIFPAFLFIGISFGGIQLHTYYDYPQIQQKINIISAHAGIYDADIYLEKPMNSVSLALSKQYSHEDIRIEWHIGGREYVRTLDTEETDDTDMYYTFPLVFDTPIERISVRIYSQEDIGIPILIAQDTISYRYHISLATARIMATSGAMRVMGRAEWGADESLRFRDSTLVQKKIQEWEARGRTPLVITQTPEQYAASQKSKKMGEILLSLHPESFVPVARIRQEGGKKLTWPIMRAQAVDRIVLHHTAETLEQGTRDDLTMIRSIYIYHARTRGWGDIGYNFIVGKDGTIYEGRAGGYYVEGAHAFANNLGTVGVSLLGNFDVNTVPEVQMRGLEELLVWIAQRYGIDVEADTIGFRTCAKGAPEDCVIEQRIIKRLHGHRDVGYTSCPGKYLYSEIDGLRRRVANRVGRVSLVYNTESPRLEPIAPEDHIQYIPPMPPSTTIAARVSPQSDTKTILRDAPLRTALIRATPAFGGKNIKIRLSYPHRESIQLSIASLGSPRTLIDNKRIDGPAVRNIDVSISGERGLVLRSGNHIYTGSMVIFSAPIVRIDSWTRIPAWDTTKRYNDNLFRSRIIIHNDGGKLLVVNELPLEDYLRGLGEVSNGDHIEKIKTITVAARSYALYYMDPKNRKYSTTLYDGSDDPDSFQRYLGYSYEMRSPRVSQVVRSTRGEVVTYLGRIVKVWYFSVSDGRTLSFLEYCQSRIASGCQDIPYLQSVSDPAGQGRMRAGHGVGISGIGATAMAEAGKTYKEIIQYYMNGVAIEKK